MDVDFHMSWKIVDVKIWNVCIGNRYTNQSCDFADFDVLKCYEQIALR